MEYGDKFKKSMFGGFNRQDVLRCFEEMNAQNAEELDALRKKLSEAKGGLAQAQAGNEGLSRENQSLARDLSETQKKLAEAQGELERLKEAQEALQKENQSLRAANSELSVKRGILETNNKALKEQVEELEKKVSEEQAGIQISEMMMEAKKTADGILVRANGRAAEQAADMEKESNAFAQRLDQLQEEAVKESESFSRFSGTVLKGLAQLQEALQHACRQLRRRPGPEEPKSAEPQEQPAVSAEAAPPETEKASERQEALEKSGHPAGKPSQESKDSRDKNTYGFLFRE